MSQSQLEKEDFILTLSHDMKNPLTAVIGSIDIVREGCLGAVNEEQEEYLQSAIDSCNEVVVMIDNLLDIRKFEAGKIHMAITTCNAKDIVNKVYHQFIRPAKHDGLELSVDIGAEIMDISVDRNALVRVLGNLLGNALKFTPEDGKIIIACHSVLADEVKLPDYVQVPPGFRKQGRLIKLSVCDNGNGILPDELNLIFDRYTQQFSQKTGRERGGAGLGLAYCKLAIESFNGIIWAECEPDQSSTFVILLPGCAQ